MAVRRYRAGMSVFPQLQTNCRVAASEVIGQSAKAALLVVPLRALTDAEGLEL
jgi:hypothetical protein